MRAQGFIHHRGRTSWSGDGGILGHGRHPWVWSLYAGEIGTLADPTRVWSLLVTVRPWRSRLAVDKTDTAVMTKPAGAGRRDAVRDGSPATALVNAAHKVIDARKVQTIF